MYDHIQKNLIQASTSNPEIFPPLQKSQDLPNEGFGNVLLYEGSIGHARALSRARTRAASFGSALGCKC